MVVQWLKLHIFSAVAQVQSLVRELGSHKSCGMAKKKKKQANKHLNFSITILVLGIRQIRQPQIPS